MIRVRELPERLAFLEDRRQAHTPARELRPQAAYRHHGFAHPASSAGWAGLRSVSILAEIRSHGLARRKRPHAGYRTATRWQPEGPALRFHIGLENCDDLKADLDRDFAAMRAAI